MTESDLTKVSLELGPRSYDILIGPGLIASAGERVRPLLRPLIRQPGQRPRAVIVTDETVNNLHAAALEHAFEDAGIAHDKVVLPPGEKTKSLPALERLLDDLLTLGVERDDTLIALGGGVTGDITGFAASILRRGIDFIQIPTTLLAQVDSSVGGKTGVNTAQGKNLIGAFHQPRLVLADTSVLDTLPAREFLSGYAEVVKYGLIDDADFFAWLEKNSSAVISGDAGARRHAVETSCRAKARVVSADERENGARALLNLGHTFGHALEAMADYGPDLRHGEAIAIGMVMAFDLSVKLGLCPPEDAERVRRHLAQAGLPVGPTAIPCLRERWSSDRMMTYIAQDKKVSGGRATYILARGIGKSFVTQDVDGSELAALLNDSLAA